MEAVETNEIAGSGILCLFGLDLQKHLGLVYIPHTGRAYRRFHHGLVKGHWGEVPVCAVQGSGLPIIRIDCYDGVDRIMRDGGVDLASKIQESVEDCWQNIAASLFM